MIAFARSGELERARRATLLVLDIDGVLLDARPSFHRAARETACWAASRAIERGAGAMPTDEDVRAFNDACGWNDDFDLAVGLTLGVALRELKHLPVIATARRSAGGPATLMEMAAELLESSVMRNIRIADIRERCAARYAGRGRCQELYGIDPARHQDLPEDGLFGLEALLASEELVRSCAIDLALFTGRNRGETRLALERFDLAVPVERWAFDDGAMPRKPAPDGLVKLVSHAGSGPMLFVGDSVDDAGAVRAYRAFASGRNLPEICFARVQENDSPGDEADLVVDGLDALLVALAEER